MSYFVLSCLIIGVIAGVIGFGHLIWNLKKQDAKETGRRAIARYIDNRYSELLNLIGVNTGTSSYVYEWKFRSPWMIDGEHKDFFDSIPARNVALRLRFIVLSLFRARYCYNPGFLTRMFNSRQIFQNRIQGQPHELIDSFIEYVKGIDDHVLENMGPEVFSDLVTIAEEEYPGKLMDLLLEMLTWAEVFTDSERREGIVQIIMRFKVPYAIEGYIEISEAYRGMIAEECQEYNALGVSKKLSRRGIRKFQVQFSKQFETVEV